MKRAHRIAFVALALVLGASGCVAESADPVVSASLSAGDLAALRALGIERVERADDDYAFMDAHGVTIGQATIAGQDDVTITLGGHEAATRWDGASMDVSCDGQSARLVQNEAGAWAPALASATPVRLEACASAFEAGRIVANAAQGISVDDVGASPQSLEAIEAAGGECYLVWRTTCNTRNPLYCHQELVWWCSN